jgi:hypothetical protein
MDENRPGVDGRAEALADVPVVRGCHLWHDTPVERTYTTPLLDKLGIRPGARVALVRIPDISVRDLLTGRTQDLTEGWPQEDTDVVLLGADSLADLDELRALRDRIHPSGAIWVVSRKGREATLRDIDVIAAARAVALVDNKVASFSATHTALRLVIPLALRER